MKQKIHFWAWALFLGVALLIARPAAAIIYLGGQINDFMDLGCHLTPGGAGSLGDGTANAGSSQAKCVPCGGAQGMPVWWVTEPYINLWVADEPLGYQTSSGQEISFRFSHRQRGLLAETAWGTREQEAFGLNITNSTTMILRYTETSNRYMTNASWQHNWWSEIVFWDPYIETNSPAPTVTRQFGTDPNNPTNAYTQYTQNYQGLLYRGDGGTIYLDSTSATTATGSGQVIVKVINQSGSNGPRVPHKYQDFYTGLDDWPYPQSGPFFVRSPFSGYQVIFPDGSQDIYGLVIYHADVTAFGPGYGPSPLLARDSTASAYLTARIDPQGRTSYVGYYANTNVTFASGSYLTNFLGYTVKYVVDPDGRTNTYNYDTNNWWQLAGITDPYGRTAQFTFDAHCGFASITDAQSNTSTFTYANSTNGWLTSMTTPYGTTSFASYELPSSGATNEFDQRAILVSEPLGAHQLFYYWLNATNTLASSIATNQVPSVPGYAFDSGNVGGGSAALFFRNSFHWDRRQFANLSGGLQSSLEGNLGSGLASLGLNDLQKASLQHWLLDASDGISVSEFVSSQVDPSPDAGGSVPGSRTWYDYSGKPPGNPQESGSPLVGCVAQMLPDGSTTYAILDYTSAGFPQDRLESYTKTDGTTGLRTNWFVYASNGIDLLTVSNSSGQSVKLVYNGVHQVANTVDALNQTNRFIWDTNTFNLTSAAFYNGSSVTLSYNAASPVSGTSARLSQIETEPNGRFLNITDYASGMPRITHVSGTGLSDLWATNTWDGLNRLTGVSFQDNTTIANVYTVLDLTAHKDRMGNWTYYGFDALQHLTSITNALTNVTTLSWCGCGALTSISDALTNLTTFNYDNQGRLTNTAYPDFSSVTSQYDLNGRVTNVVDGSGRSTQFAYNNQGLVTTVSNAAGLVSKVVYDGLDRPANATDANNVTVTNTFDLLNRLVARSWPDGTNEGWGYATNGLIAYTNRDHQVTRYVRDGASRITTVSNANLERVTFAYDPLDRVVSLTDGLGHVRGWRYNQYGWLTGKTDNSANDTFRYYYNANGWLTNRWTPGSTNTTYGYDAVGNLTGISYPGSVTPPVTMAYNAVNWLTNVVDGTGTNAFTYTANGQLATESYGLGNATVSNAYTQGARTAMTVGTFTNGYAYDATWRLQSLTSSAGAFNYNYPASASALVTGIQLPNGASIVNQYDGLSRLTNTALQNFWGHLLDGYGYAYGRADYRTQITRSLGLTTNSVVAGYDNIGQLTSWKASESGGAGRLNEQLGYGYDAAHNLSTRTNNALVQSFAVDAFDELTGISRGGTLTVSGSTPAPATNITVNGASAQRYGDFTFAATNFILSNGTNTFTIVAANVYGLTTNSSVTVNLPTTVNLSSDTNGNLIGDGTRTFYYDAENQLTNVFVTNIWKTEFAYDGFGRRRIERDYTWSGSAWSRTNETRYIFDGLVPIQERDSNNAVLVTYTRGLDLSGGINGAGGIGGLLARTDANGSTYYHADGAGNVTALIDGYQNIVARYEYDAYGRQIGQWGKMAAVNQYRFSTYITTPSGLVLSPTRLYLPEFQRWNSLDPIGESGGVNLYGFVGNGPVNSVDPYGLDFWDYIPGIGAGRRRAQGEQALREQLKAHGYDSEAEFKAANPLLFGDQTPTAGNLSAVKATAEIAAGATDLYLQAGQQIAMSGIVTKGTQAAAQGIADATEEGWLSKLWNKCKFWKKKPAAKGAGNAAEGIYEFTAASGKTYVGQSGNIATRLEQHVASGKLLPGTPVTTTEVLGGKTAREISEQLRINELGGIKNLENIRNPIGPNRQHLLP